MEKGSSKTDLKWQILNSNKIAKKEASVCFHCCLHALAADNQDHLVALVYALVSCQLLIAPSRLGKLIYTCCLEMKQATQDNTLLHD